MERRREPLLFLAVLALVGVMSWLRWSDSYQMASMPSHKTLEAEVVPRPALARAGAAPDLPESTREESVFAPPRELLPLDPLQLPEPPLPRLSVRRPAEVPSLAGAAARAYRVSPDSLGSLVVSAEVLDPNASPGGDEESDSGAAGASPPAPGGKEAGANGGGAKPANGSAKGPVAKGADGKDAAAKPGNGAKPGTAKTPGADAPAEQAALEARFDWVARTDNKARLYGTLLNDDPVGLPQRPGEDLRFQQVSESTGRPLGAPFIIPRPEVLEFALAATFDNTYLQRSRALGSGAGASAARRDLALELLAVADTEQHALQYALTEAALAHDAAPADPANLRLLTFLRRRAFDLQGELAVYREALAAHVADPALVADYARCVRGLGLRERAWELHALAQTLGRQTAEVPVAHALLLMDDGRWEEARAALDTASNLPFLGPLEDGQKRELVLLGGRVQLALGVPEEALKAANRVLLDDPADADAHVLAGAAQAAQEALEPAGAAFAAAVVGDPLHAVALTDGGLVAQRRRDGDGARRLLWQAVTIDPVHAAAPMLALGFLAEDAGDPSKARDAYAAALELEPGHPEALYRLGRSQRQDGDPEAATATLRQALRLAGPDLLVLLELGRAALDRSRHEEALRYFREAERLEPDNAEVQWFLGLAALANGDTLGCRAPLTAAAGNGKPGAHVALGVASYRRGDAQAALDHFDEVAKAYAGHDDDSQARYAAEESAAIRDNLSKRQWLDRFGRSTLQRGWVEHAWDGSPRVISDGTRVVVAGRMEKPREGERPGIARTVDGKAFYACAAELALQPGGETRAGLSLTYSQVKGAQGRLPKAQLDIFVDTDGTVRMSALDNFDTKVLDAVPVEGLQVAPGETVLLGIERLDDVAGTYAFSVGGHRVGAPVEIKSLRSFKNPFDLQVWAEAAPGRTVGADVVLVRIVQAP